GLGHLDLAGHSLRAGFATSAAAAGKSERAIMRQTGHTSLPMVRRYIREGSLFRDNPTDGLAL
ncbi:integrase, partial [Enterococcus hirae]